MTDTILEFQGEYRFLSNFYPSPIEMYMLDRMVYFPSGEHAYQAYKSIVITPDTPENAMAYVTDVSYADTAYLAKRYGRLVQIDASKWEGISGVAMFYVTLNKYRQNPDLAQRLLATGDALLVEGNTWGDRIWGQVNGVGENRLGKILMQVREELRND